MNILLIGAPRLLREVMACIVSECPALELMGVLSDPRELMPRVRTCRPDCVIASVGDVEVERACRQLLAIHPDVRVLAVADGGRQGYLYQPTPGLPGWSALGELSAELLVEAAHAGRS